MSFDLTNHQTAHAGQRSGNDLDWRVSKLRTVAELGSIAREYRKRGHSVVYCHGTFDLLHPGHLRHFEAARKEGDVLMVGLTADKFVNKGPGRPYFPEALRAEMIAALACVDYVSVVHAQSSVEALEGIQPDVYAKGSDYTNAEDDLTGMIVHEREAVERHGGRIHFTNDITFSSSSLLNQHFDLIDPSARAFLHAQREDGAKRKLFECLEKIKDYKVLMIGDIIIDDYSYTSPLGKSPKENIIVTQFKERERFAGGVAAAANHVAGLCREVQIISCHGERDSYVDLVRNSLRPNVKLWSLPRTGLPTTRKSRFLEQGYMRKLFEVYFMDDTHLSDEEEQALIDQVHKYAKDADLVVVTDFGHGLITPRVIETLEALPNFLAVNAQTNSANIGFNLITRYPRANFVCIDGPEARLAVADKKASLEDVAGRVLPSKLNCERIIVTAGMNGCYTYDRAHGVTHIPALTKTVVDTVGAGDAFFVVTAPLIRAGLPIFLAGLVGNVAGAIKVQILGHQRSVEKATIMKYLETLFK